MFCNFEKQCCAITIYNTRCIKNVTGKSDHCDLHRPTAKKLYTAYKDICSKADEFDIENNSNIQYLTRAYIWLNSAFDARMKHRKYAFVPECYDEGHDFQFTLIKQKINLCETKLAELYKTTNMITNEVYVKSTKPKKNKKNSSSSSSTNSDDGIDSNISIPARIYKYQKQRQVISTDIDQYISQYIEENKIIKERKKILVNYIRKCILGLIRNNDTDLSLFCSTIYYILCELYSIDYFDRDFVPERCNCNRCDNFVSYKMDQFCGCTHCTDERFLLKLSEENLKKMYELLLLNKSKIQPVINSLLYYYHFYGKNIIALNYELTWDNKINSLVLKQIFVEEQIKKSKLFSMTRLRDKYYIQKMQQEFELIDSDDSDSDDDSDSFPILEPISVM